MKQHDLEYIWIDAESVAVCVCTDHGRAFLVAYCDRERIAIDPEDKDDEIYSLILPLKYYRQFRRQAASAGVAIAAMGDFPTIQPGESK
jgi:hypothetical protein